MDTLKTRYQTAEEGRYNNIADVYNEVIKEDGIAGLFNGMGPAMIRSAPANAVSFLGAEVTKKVLSFIA
jgi:solute carrier family 25 carnitine/acylcarnitine transporter 20/29